MDKVSKFEKLKQLYINKNLIINLCILACLFFASCYAKFVMWFAFPIMAVMILLDSVENGFSYVIFGAPFHFINDVYSLLAYLICAVLFVVKYFIILFVKDKQKVSKLTLVLLSIFFVYMILPIGPYTLRMGMKVVMLLFVLILVSALLKKSERLCIERNIRIYALALIVSALFSVPFGLNHDSQEFDGSNFPRFQALFDRATVLSMFCEIAIGLLAFNFVKTHNWKDCVLFVLITIMGALTLSKTFLIILLVVLVMVFVFSVRANPKKTLIISGCGLAVVALLGLVFPQYALLIFHRFFGKFNQCKSFEDVLNMVTTSRYELWVEYLQFLAHNPARLIFGSGLGAVRVGAKSSHNAYISIVYQLGNVGTALFVATIVSIFREIKNSRKEKEIKQGKPKKDLRFIIPLTVIALILMVEDMILFILP